MKGVRSKVILLVLIMALIFGYLAVYNPGGIADTIQDRSWLVFLFATVCSLIITFGYLFGMKGQA